MIRVLVALVAIAATVYSQDVSDGKLVVGDWILDEIDIESPLVLMGYAKYIYQYVMAPGLGRISFIEVTDRTSSKTSGKVEFDYENVNGVHIKAYIKMTSNLNMPIYRKIKIYGKINCRPQTN